MKIAHIVNPLRVRNPDSELNFAQPITLRSMQVAREHAQQHGGPEVRQLVAAYEEDLATVPAGFEMTPLLDRSILDCVEGQPGEKRRKLPLLADILDRAWQAAPDADYLVYTNIDIGLQPDFYPGVAELIDAGHDAFVIARRTVSDEFRSVDDLPRIHALPGKLHYGYSCFVFPRAHYARYRLLDTCIGIQPVSISLVLNMIAQAGNFANVTDRRLTFHLGPDGAWNDTLLDTYHRYNEQQLDQIRRLLRDELCGSEQADWVLGVYFKYRARWVIRGSTSPLQKAACRVMRKLGCTEWVAAQY